jgi:hypothetical protein
VSRQMFCTGWRGAGARGACTNIGHGSAHRQGWKKPGSVGVFKGGRGKHGEEIGHQESILKLRLDMDCSCGPAPVNGRKQKHLFNNRSALCLYDYPRLQILQPNPAYRFIVL